MTEGKHKIGEYIGRVEVHVKYCGDWLCVAHKDKVREDHLGHAVNLLALQLERNIEQLLSGRLNIEQLPKNEEGQELGLVIPDEVDTDDDLR